MEKGKDKVLHFRLPKDWEFDPNFDRQRHPDYKEFVDKALKIASSVDIEIGFYAYTHMAIGYRDPFVLADFLSKMES